MRIERGGLALACLLLCSACTVVTVDVRDGGGGGRAAGGGAVGNASLEIEEGVWDVYGMVGTTNAITTATLAATPDRLGKISVHWIAPGQTSETWCLDKAYAFPLEAGTYILVKDSGNWLADEALWAQTNTFINPNGNEGRIPEHHRITVTYH